MKIIAEMEMYDRAFFVVPDGDKNYYIMLNKTSIYWH